MTLKAFENAATVVYAMGGSTNAYLHLLALARECDLEDSFTIDTFARVGSKVPLIANMSPHGPYHMSDLHDLGGVPIVLRELLDAGLLHGDAMTVTGRTVEGNLTHDEVPTLGSVAQPSPAVVRGTGDPLSPAGNHLTVLSNGGTLTPGGSAILKLSGKDLPLFEGPAVVFDDEFSAFEAITRIDSGVEHDARTSDSRKRIRKGDVLVIRNEGLREVLGCQEMLSPGAALVGAGMVHVALVTDGRFSGASREYGGTADTCFRRARAVSLALVEDGDTIRIDAREAGWIL